MERLFRHPQMLERYRALPFGSWLPGYVERLQDQGYCRRTILRRLFRLGRLGEYLQTQGSGPQHLVEDGVLENYLEHRCRCFLEAHGREMPAEHCRQIRSAVEGFVLWARQEGHLSSSPSPEEVSGAKSSLIGEYLDFCREHRGLGKSALWMRRHWLLRLEEFLEEQQEPGLCGISLPALDRFIAGVAQCSSRSTTQWVVGVLRTLLRYLFLVGREREDRSPLLQSPRVYRRMKVPRHLTDEQLEEALLKVDRTTPRGKRDWAVLMLLCGYGLRAGEASRLRLKDVDFEGHRLFVRRLKGAGTRIFPLTSAVEGALREYLAEARPACSHPEVFLTCHPPFRPFPSGSSLSNSCVRQYIKHLTGLPSRGAHALRHTLARRMLQSGAPLEVVRRTLGHRDMNTTCGYLRISIEELREVADNYAELL